MDNGNGMIGTIVGDIVGSRKLFERTDDTPIESE